VAGGDVEVYWERGGAGEPLLLIQGMSGTHMSWGLPFREQLQADFEVFAFDNRGIGLSPEVEEPFTIAEMAADTVALLDRLELESVHVLGISMGGMIAQELALAHPERVQTLTLGCTYCGGPGSALMDPADFQALAEAQASGDRGRMLAAMYELNLSPGFREAGGEEAFAVFTEMATSVPVRNRTIQLQVQAILSHDTSARLPGLELPTLVVHGTADRVLAYPNGPLIDSLLPDSHLETLEGVGHLFWWERPEESAALLRAHALG
jgi:3-oxoadipate enol-lactonase